MGCTHSLDRAALAALVFVAACGDGVLLEPGLYEVDLAIERADGCYEGLDRFQARWVIDQTDEHRWVLSVLQSPLVLKGYQGSGLIALDAKDPESGAWMEAQIKPKEGDNARFDGYLATVSGPCVWQLEASGKREGD